MFRKFFSYLWPVTTTVHSDYNGKLKITWYNGRKTLDTRETNYSYGLLQRVLAFGLSQIQFNRQEETLLLGMGAGSVIATLRDEFNYREKITAVEFDQKVIAVARKEFEITQYAPLEIKHEDAASFVTKDTRHYGLILIDLFIDTSVPEKFYHKRFWRKLLPLLSPSGIILFNGGFTKDSQKQLLHFRGQWETKLDFKEFRFPHAPNRLLGISKKRNKL